jgi:Uma2 family endonuclease
VLSPATAATDRGRKKQLLARYSVREYWLVDPEERAVEIHALEGTAFSLVGTVGGQHAIASPLLGSMTDPVAGLFHSPI